MPFSCWVRRVLAYSLSLRVRYLSRERVLLELKVSGMQVLGQIPYFLIKSANMSHWPPSPIGDERRKAIVLEEVFSSRVVKMASRK